LIKKKKKVSKAETNITRRFDQGTEEEAPPKKRVSEEGAIFNTGFTSKTPGTKRKPGTKYKVDKKKKEGVYQGGDQRPLVDTKGKFKSDSGEVVTKIRQLRKPGGGGASCPGVWVEWGKRAGRWDGAFLVGSV